MPLSRPTVVLFDMDGTTVRHLNPRTLQVMEVLDDLFYRFRRMGAGVSKYFGWATKFRLRRKATRKPRLIVHRALHKMRRKPVDEIVEPCPGIIDILELLRERGVRMAVVSNGLGQGYGHDVLQKFDLVGFFDAAVFREDSVKSKPDPEPLNEAIRRLNVHLTPDNVVWVIGDRPKDIAAAQAMAKQLPCKVEAIGYGLHTAVALFEHGLPADRLVMSYEDWYGTVEEIVGANAALRRAPVVPEE